MKPFRKHRIPFLLPIISAVLACNFPLSPASIIRKSYPTLDQAIFDAHKTPAAASTAAAAASTPAITSPNPTPVIDAVGITYSVQSGDTLDTVAQHFGVSPDQITSPQYIPARGLIQPGQILIIPPTEVNTKFETPILPDSAVISSPCTQDFDLFEFAAQAGGYLNAYQQKVGDETLSGVEVVRRVADNTSVNPRLLLALVEFRSGWVYRYTSNPNTLHPLGLNLANYEGLYLELSAAARMINTGYYAWRQGMITEITFTDQQSARISPNLNAGSVGIEYLFAQLYPRSALDVMLFGEYGFMPVYQDMFGDAWQCASTVEPLFPASLQAPHLELPFAPGETWALTGGLHPAWNTGTPYGALDFAPVTGEPVCAVSRSWVRASASGVVTYSANGMVTLAAEDDLGQPTGWEVVYMHVAASERVTVGTHLNTNDPVGHPSCEGGAATGTHVHITRKYKGEWIGAGDPFPFTLSGYTALTGMPSFQGGMVNGANIITPRQDARQDSIILR